MPSLAHPHGFIKTVTIIIVSSLMPPRTTAIFVTIALAAIGVLADNFLKLASDQPNPTKNAWFLAGVLTYTSTAFGWVVVMKHLNLSHIGVYYSSTTLLLLVILGVVFYGEKLRATEMLGIAMALGSIFLLARVA